MKKILLPATLLALTLASAPAFSNDSKPSILVINPWIRALPGQPMAAAYVTLGNSSTQPDVLTGAVISGVNQLQIHKSEVIDGIMHMSEVENGISIAAGKETSLKPGSYHLMLMSLSKPFPTEGKISGTLFFQKAGSVPVEFLLNPKKHGEKEPSHRH